MMHGSEPKSIFDKWTSLFQQSGEQGVLWICGSETGVGPKQACCIPGRPRVHLSTLTAGRSRLHPLVSDPWKFYKCTEAENQTTQTATPRCRHQTCHACPPWEHRNEESSVTPSQHRHAGSIIIIFIVFATLHRSHRARPSRSNWNLGPESCAASWLQSTYPQLPPTLQLLERSGQELVHHVGNRLAFLGRPRGHLQSTLLLLDSIRSPPERRLMLHYQHARFTRLRGAMCRRRSRLISSKIEASRGAECAERQKLAQKRRSSAGVRIQLDLAFTDLNSQRGAVGWWAHLLVHIVLEGHALAGVNVRHVVGGELAACLHTHSGINAHTTAGVPQHALPLSPALPTHNISK